MSSNARWRSALSQARVGRGLAVAVCVSVSACSADVTRFDFPAFNLAEDTAPTGALPGSPGYAQRPGQSFDGAAGVPPRGVGAPNQPPATVYGSAYPGERIAARGEAPQTTTLPPIVPEHRPAPPPEPSFAGERPRQGLAAEPAPERAPALARELAPQGKGTGAQPDSIEVGQGDTLYGISKRYGVALADLIDANGLHHGASLKPGQQIVLPPGTLARAARREARAKPTLAVVPVAKVALTPGGALATNAAPRAPEIPAAEPPRAAQLPAGPASAAWQARQTIRTGDSFNAMARQQRVGLAELQRVNGIANPLRVKVGTTLKVPGRTEAAASRPTPAVVLA